jgi:hypothetical protein
MCHAFGRPSVLEYWHIGATKTRFRKLSSRRRRGLNNDDMEQG